MIITTTSKDGVTLTFDESFKLYPSVYLKVKGQIVTAHSTFTGTTLSFNERGYFKVSPKQLDSIRNNKNIEIDE